MYIWKEVVHGKRHADQDADYGLDIQTHFLRELSFAVKLKRKTTQFAVLSFNVFPSKTMPRLTSDCRIQICSI